MTLEQTVTIRASLSFSKPDGVLVETFYKPGGHQHEIRITVTSWSALTAQRQLVETLHRIAASVSDTLAEACSE